MATTTPTVFDIKRGDIVEVTLHGGAKERINVIRDFYYDETNTITDETGWDTVLYPGDEFRFIHRARR